MARVRFDQAPEFRIGSEGVLISKQNAGTADVLVVKDSSGNTNATMASDGSATLNTLQVGTVSAQSVTVAGNDFTRDVLVRSYMEV